MKKQLLELKIKTEDFYGLRKDQKTVIFKEGPLDIYGIVPKDKVILVDELTGKKRIRKAKRIRCCSTLRETIEKTRNSKLGLKWWEERDYRTLNIAITMSSIVENGIVGIEFKRKMTFKRFIKRTILALIILISLVSFKNYLIELNDERINEQITRLNRDRPRYIFADVDAEMILTVMGDKIVEVTCRNDKCLEIDPEEEIRFMEITKGVKYLYEYAAHSGCSYSKGIKLRSHENIILGEDLDFVFREHISLEEEEKLLKEAKERRRLVDIMGVNYYDLLWKELKKDYQYDKVYSCSMDGGTLKCHFLEKAIKPLKKTLKEVLEGKLHFGNGLRTLLWMRFTEIEHTLDKFNIPNTFRRYSIDDGYPVNQIILDGEYYHYAIDYNYQKTDIENAVYYRDLRNTECISELKVCLATHREIAFSILDMDLLNPAASLEDPEVNVQKEIYVDGFHRG